MTDVICLGSSITRYLRQAWARCKERNWWCVYKPESQCARFRIPQRVARKWEVPQECNITPDTMLKVSNKKKQLDLSTAVQHVSKGSLQRWERTFMISWFELLNQCTKLLWTEAREYLYQQLIRIWSKVHLVTSCIVKLCYLQYY